MTEQRCGRKMNNEKIKEFFEVIKFILKNIPPVVLLIIFVMGICFPSGFGYFLQLFAIIVFFYQKQT